VAVQADMAKANDVERLFSDARTAFGRLDIVVNNARVYEFMPVEQITEAHFHRQFDVNVPGLILAAREAVKEESDFRKQVETRTPLGRVGQPQDIAPAVVFLASADAAWITGETLLIAGGLR
jgi:NAD(P)-dependent dehydrogenase (short-subunit alcohol dehydrogenase family)